MEVHSHVSIGEPHINTNQKIKVLIVDDSAVMRQLLAAMLNQDPNLEVVGVAPDSDIARHKIKALKPDVLTLDIEMPGLDGITFLEKLMRLHPMPVVMISSATRKGAAATLRALELGAVDFVAKPPADAHVHIEDMKDEIISKIHAAAQACIRSSVQIDQIRSAQNYSTVTACARNRRGVIVIGASAGGTQAIGEVLKELSPSIPGIVIVQHMPPPFTGPFAERLDSQCGLEVREANDNDKIVQGTALVAPGGYHTRLALGHDGYLVRVFEGEMVNRHRLAVDILFESVATGAGADALGIILTGMGMDGARGLQRMKLSGAHTIAQDEQSCMIFGMPQQAIRLGGVTEIVNLSQIPARIHKWAETPSSPDDNDPG